MAPKANYTHERLAAVASQSVAKARVDYGGSSFMEHFLGCDPIRQPGVQLKRTSEVAFRWRFRGAGYDEVAELTGRCNNVFERGVPFPESWATALRCLSLDEIAVTSAGKIRSQDQGLSDLRCEVLGRPKPLSAAGSIGKLVALASDGNRVSYFLCAPVHEDVWLVHRGSYKATGELDLDDPFQETDLVAKDIGQDAWDMKKQRRRLRT